MHYTTEVQCDHCLEKFTVSFTDPDSRFSAECPDCGAYYPELYV